MLFQLGIPNFVKKKEKKKKTIKIPLLFVSTYLYKAGFYFCIFLQKSNIEIVETRSLKKKLQFKYQTKCKRIFMFNVNSIIAFFINNLLMFVNYLSR